MPNSGQLSAFLPLHLNAVGWQESPNREFDPAPQPLPVRALLHQPTPRYGTILDPFLAGPFSGPAFFPSAVAPLLRPIRASVKRSKVLAGLQPLAGKLRFS